MIDVKTAVGKAKQYGAQILGYNLKNLLVEKVELSDDGEYWYVTLGWDLDQLGIQRTYKLFKIRAADGEVISMKIRTVA